MPSGPMAAVTFLYPAHQKVSASIMLFARMTAFAPAIPSRFHTPRIGPGSHRWSGVPARRLGVVFLP